MIQCPRCGHAILEAGGGQAKLLQKVVCSGCEHAWIVAAVEPMTLAEVDDEEQRAETD